MSNTLLWLVLTLIATIYMPDEGCAALENNQTLPESAEPAPVAVANDTVNSETPSNPPDANGQGDSIPTEPEAAPAPAVVVANDTSNSGTPSDPPVANGQGDLTPTEPEATPAPAVVVANDTVNSETPSNLPDPKLQDNSKLKTREEPSNGQGNSFLKLPQGAAPLPIAFAIAGADDATSSVNCPFKPVPGHPEKFESKTVPGAIFTCPHTLEFDFFFFPCGCFPVKATPTQIQTTEEPGDSCPYKPVAGHPEKFESKTAPGLIQTCPVGMVFDFNFFPCGCFPEDVTDIVTSATDDPDTCPYKAVDGQPEQFESKTVPGAISSCPIGQVFDFEFFPCGCFPDSDFIGFPQDGTCPYMPVPGSPEQFASKTVVGAIQSCPIGQHSTIKMALIMTSRHRITRSSHPE
ncbi:hypothetical protein LSAT2_016589 [Lamellibrachia satsuma]|nr:hypothetical protein LSAT2_016589 [Lamellibrachia satsuma]